MGFALPMDPTVCCHRLLALIAPAAGDAHASSVSAVSYLPSVTTIPYRLGATTGYVSRYAQGVVDIVRSLIWVRTVYQPTYQTWLHLPRLWDGP